MHLSVRKTQNKHTSMKDLNKTVGYIWYNPDFELYQKGKKEEYDAFCDSSARKAEFSLILRLTPVNDMLAYKMVKELNETLETSRSYKVAI